MDVLYISKKKSSIKEKDRKNDFDSDDENPRHRKKIGKRKKKEMNDYNSDDENPVRKKSKKEKNDFEVVPQSQNINMDDMDEDEKN